jgi:hypothetical protein
VFQEIKIGSIFPEPGILNDRECMKFADQEIWSRLELMSLWHFLRASQRKTPRSSSDDEVPLIVVTINI